jgi:pimeloyl-ACP methyl ester carboxylesterase
MWSPRIALSAVVAVVAVCTAAACDRGASDRPVSITGDLPALALSAPSPADKPVIVLVHGAFADATSWQALITILQDRQYRVIAVQNTLTGLAADIATTKRVIDAQQGPMIVVGHSYGGAVITGAAAGNPNVKALVYLSAFAPEANEPIGSLQANFPPTALASALVPDAVGFLYGDTAKFRDVFAQDLPVRLTRIVAATQKPLIASAFGESTPQAAWHTVPSWYIVATEDHALNPDLERFYAARIKAHTTEIRSSHVSYISHPDAVARVIEDAAKVTASLP